MSGHRELDDLFGGRRFKATDLAQANFADELTQRSNPIDAPPVSGRQKYGPSGLIPGPKDGQVVPVQDPAEAPRLVVVQRAALPPASSEQSPRTVAQAWSRVNYVGQGQAFGTAISGGQYAADQILQRVDEGDSVWAKDLRASVSPYFHKYEIAAGKFKSAAAAYHGVETSYRLTEEAHTNAVFKATELFKEVDLPSARTKAVSLIDVCERLKSPEKVVQFFSKGGTYSQAELAAVREVAETAATYGDAHKLLTDAESAMTKAQSAMSRAEVNTALSAKGAGMSLAKGFGVGTLITGGELTARYGLDYVSGRDTSNDASWSWGTTNLSVPLILSSGMTNRKKATAVTVSVLGAVALDHYAPPPEGRMREIFRPNIADAGLGTLAALSPGTLKQKSVKFGLAAVGGRVWGAGCALYNEAPVDEKKVAAHEVLTKFTTYERKRTYAAFEEAITTARKHAYTDERTVVQLLNETRIKYDFPFDREFKNKKDLVEFWKESMRLDNKDELAGFSATGCVNAALGEFKLDSGSRLCTKVSQIDSGVRIMQGCNYDLGGEAYSCLRDGALCLWEARNVAKEKGVSESELSDLTKQLEHIDKTIEQAVDGHDMDKAFHELSENALPLKFSYVAAFGPQLKQTIASLDTSDTRYHAKLCRDYALLCMAWAKFQGDRGNSHDAQMMMGESLEHLRKANQLDPKSADGQWLMQKAPAMAHRAGVTIPPGYFDQKQN